MHPFVYFRYFRFIFEDQALAAKDYLESCGFEVKMNPDVPRYASFSIREKFESSDSIVVDLASLSYPFPELYKLDVIKVIRDYVKSYDISKRQ